MLKNYHVIALILFTAMVIVTAQAVRSADDRGSISGVVKSKTGQVVVGAFVTAKQAGGNLEFTVISQGEGRYKIPNVPAGKYTLQSMGAGMQSDAAMMDVQGGAAATENLTLSSAADIRKTVPMNVYSNLMPEDPAKDFIVSNCTDCHQSGLQEILYSRKSAENWAKTVERMKNHPYGYARSLEISDRTKAIVLTYLTKNYGPDALPLDDQKLAGALVTGPAAKAIVTEFDLPSGARPHDLTVDSKGIVWVGEGGLGVLGRFDPKTYSYTRITVPGEKPSVAGLILDPQGRLWFEDHHNHFMEYDPKTEKFEPFDYPKPASGNGDINSIRVQSDGTVWGTEIAANAVVRLNPNTKETTVYKAPADANTNTSPYGLAVDSNNMIWFVEARVAKIAKIDPANGEISEYSVPSKPSRMRRMAADNSGNVWFGEFGSNFLGMIDTRTGKITEYAPPSKNSGPYSIDVDNVRGRIWVNEMMADQIATFDPQTKTWVEYTIPTRYSSVRRIELDPSTPNRVWYAGLNQDKIGSIELLP